MSENPRTERISDSKFHFVWKKLRKSGHYEEFLSKYCPLKDYFFLCNPEKMEALQSDGLMNDMHGRNIDFLGEIEDAGKTVFKDPYFFWYTYKSKLSGIVDILSNHKIRNPFQNQRIEPILAKHLPKDRKYLVQSKSYNHRLFTHDQMKQLRKYNKIIVLSSYLVVMFGFIFLVKVRCNVRFLGVVSGLFYGHLVNSSLMGFFANPNARYCSRTSWMLVFAALLVVAYLIAYRAEIKSLDQRR
ncbi:MAG: hypothetical protein GY705_24825 [Bacteroidetes bacterium]|nr:hypothetical protein [Bacteroidota bacterium]